jgi:hypothetical protein
MSLLNVLRGSRRPAPRNRPRRQLVLEPLEDRLCPSGGYLLVDSYNTSSVLRYDETTGAFVDELVKKNSGGLYSSADMDLGPDHNLYASNGLFSFNNKANDVLRYDGTAGAFLGDFADSGQLTDPRGVIFGRDGNLYVADGNGPGRVLRYDGQTGAFLDTFVPTGSGGLSHPGGNGTLFGPDGNLYVIAADQSEILRYDGQTGAFLGTFVTSGSGGLSIPLGMAFGPDGNFYVANTRLHEATGGGILRYQGPAGPNPGAFLDTFVAPGSGGLIRPLSVLFGPAGNLYVASTDLPAFSRTAKPHTSTVLRYDGTTGAFLGTFVTPDSGGLRYPDALLFSETDPVTRRFNGTEDEVAARAASLTTLRQPALNPTIGQPGFASPLPAAAPSVQAQTMFSSPSTPDGSLLAGELTGNGEQDPSARTAPSAPAGGAQSEVADCFWADLGGLLADALWDDLALRPHR